MVFYDRLRAPQLVHQISCYCQSLAREDENVAPLVRQKPFLLPNLATSLALPNLAPSLLMIWISNVFDPRVENDSCAKMALNQWSAIAKKCQNGTVASQILPKWHNQWRCPKVTTLLGAG